MGQRAVLDLRSTKQFTFNVEYPIDGGKAAPDCCTNDIKKTWKIDPFTKSFTKNLRNKIRVLLVSSNKGYIMRWASFTVILKLSKVYMTLSHRSVH